MAIVFVYLFGQKGPIVCSCHQICVCVNALIQLRASTEGTSLLSPLDVQIGSRALYLA